MQKLKEEFEQSGGTWKSFKIGDLFDIRPTKSYKMTNAHIFEKSGNVPVVTNSSRSNGITGYTVLKPTEVGGIITYSDTTTSEGIFYQPDDFVGYSHIQGLYPKNKNSWSERSLLYFVSLFRKSAGGRFDYANKFNRENAKSLCVLLPMNRKGKISFDYMERYISELEEERISELAAYLKVTGLENCVLTKPEKLALKSRGGGATCVNLRWVICLNHKMVISTYNKSILMGKGHSSLVREFKIMELLAKAILMQKLFKGIQ